MPHKSNVVIAKKGSFVVELEAGKNYFWCTCGRSEKQPFCDGSHKDTEFTPMKFTPEVTKKYGLCGCKHTQNAPFCDGGHNNLD